MRVMETHPGVWAVVQGDWKVVDDLMVHDDFEILADGIESKKAAQAVMQAVTLLLQAEALGLKTVMQYAALQAQAHGYVEPSK